MLRIAAVSVLFAGFSGALAQGDPRGGQYVAKAAGCLGCHTDTTPGSQPYAGGRPVDTPFGTFYGPNITPHLETGLGKWSEADFRRAIRLGERPDGAHYFPAFPYPTFTRMADKDVGDLWAFLRGLPAVNRPNRPHDFRFPIGWRFLVKFWKWLFFEPGPFVPDPRASAVINRGAYLVGALGHCNECHTPRNLLGGMKTNRSLAGAKLPEGRTPNLTPTRLKKWTDVQLNEFLRTGISPEGDLAADSMYEVVRNTTSQLTPDDRAAMIAYLRSLAPRPDEPR